MMPDATACCICVCAYAYHDGVVKPSRIKDQMREQEEQTFINENKETSYATSCKNRCSRHTVLAERGVKQTQERAKMTEVESYEYKRLQSIDIIVHK